MLKMLITFLIVPFLYSCQNSATAQEYSFEKEVAYVQVAKTKHTKHTKRVKKKQRDICERLKRIHKRIERKKNRKRNRKGGK